MKWAFYLVDKTQFSESRGTRVYDLKPFYRGAKITVISSKPQTSSSNDFKWFDGRQRLWGFYQRMLSPKVMVGAVVVMDNPAHKIASIETLIQSVGASTLNLSPYFLTLIQLNIGGHNWKLLRQFLLGQQNGWYINCNCTWLVQS